MGCGRGAELLVGLLRGIVGLLAGQESSASTQRPVPSAEPVAGRVEGFETVEIRPPGPQQLRITYAPERDGEPDAGEVVWTWVPFAENDGRGKDRPVLVIGRQSADRVFAVKLTSKDRDGDRDFLPIGSGAWDSKGRPSWVDIDQVYSVHTEGTRREAAVLDLKRFAVVAHALQRRYGWQAGD